MKKWLALFTLISALPGSATSRAIAYLNPPVQWTNPDFKTLKEWSTYFETQAKTQAFMRDSIGITQATVEVFAMNDQQVTALSKRVQYWLDRDRVRYRADAINHMSRGTVVGCLLNISDPIRRPDTYFDLRDSLLSLSTLAGDTSITVQVDEDPYRPTASADSAKWFIDQLMHQKNALPVHDRGAFESYAVRKILPRMDDLRHSTHHGLTLRIQIGRLLTPTEIRAAEQKPQTSGLTWFNRDKPFAERIHRMETQIWIGMGLGGFSTFGLIVLAYISWRSRRASTWQVQKSGHSRPHRLDP